jgi:metal iron transporter
MSDDIGWQDESTSELLESHSPTLFTTTLSGNSEMLSQSTKTTRFYYLFQSITILKKFIKYIGPGLMVSVAYMDPGNFSSSIASAQFQYKLLFSLLISNIMAGFLQILASKLGICTGQDLAANCKTHLPSILNYIIYIFAEISVIATDVAEIIGTAIAFYIIFNIPLIIGVLLSILDMLFVIMAYRPNGPMILLRIFEGFVSLLVFGTVICFAIELGKVSPTTDWSQVALGFLPSKIIFTDIKGLYLSAALLGSNLMPHSLYLGSGVVQARMKAFDIKMGHFIPTSNKKSHNLFTFQNDEDDENDDETKENENEKYKPSIHAINETMNYTIAELIVSLIFVALFVNAAILIVAGSALSNPTDDDGDGALENADLFTLHHLLTSHLSKAAGSIFAFALLCSGLCGGTVVTIAGQMIMEGHSNARLPPGIKRIITRALALIPCVLVVLTSGREGLSAVLNASQVVLSFMLPFISAPLIYFTSSREIMKVETFEDESLKKNDNRNQKIEFVELQNLDKSDRNNENDPCAFTGEMEVGSIDNFEEDHRQHPTQDEIKKFKNMSNSKLTIFIAVFVWVSITFLNFWLLTSMALGKDVPL